MTGLAAIGRNEIYDYVDALFTVYLVLIFIRILLTWVPRLPFDPDVRAAVAFVEGPPTPTSTSSAPSCDRWDSAGWRSTSARSWR